jgi:hypothetical protein
VMIGMQVTLTGQTLHLILLYFASATDRCIADIEADADLLQHMMAAPRSLRHRCVVNGGLNAFSQGMSNVRPDPMTVRPDPMTVCSRRGIGLAGDRRS